MKGKYKMNEEYVENQKSSEVKPQLAASFESSGKDSASSRDKIQNSESENTFNSERNTSIDELLNTIKQRHGEINFFKRTSIRPNGEFIIFNKEILKRKDKDGKLLKDIIIGHFVRDFSLAYNWNLNQRGISTITGTCVDTVGKYDNELRKLGYLETYQPRYSDGTFAPTINIINETANEDLWDKDSLPPEIQYLVDNFPQFKKPVRNLSDSASPDTDLPNTENSDLYKNRCKHRKETKDRRDIISKEENSVVESSSSKSSSSSNSSSLKSSVSSSSLNTEDTSYMQTCSSSQKHTLNRAENSAAKPKKKAGRKTNVEKLKEEFLSQFQNEPDEELRKYLVKFFTVYIEKKKYLNQITFDEKLMQLEDLSQGDINKKRYIVRCSVLSGWTDFYPINDKSMPDFNNYCKKVRSNSNSEEKITKDEELVTNNDGSYKYY